MYNKALRSFQKNGSGKEVKTCQMKKTVEEKSQSCLLRPSDDPWIVFYKSLKPFLFSVFDLNC